MQGRRYSFDTQISALIGKRRSAHTVAPPHIVEDDIPQNNVIGSVTTQPDDDAAFPADRRNKHSLARMTLRALTRGPSHKGIVAAHSPAVTATRGRFLSRKAL